MALPATAGARLCHKPLSQDRCCLGICAPALRDSQDPSPQRCFPSPTTPSAHPVTTLPQGFASEKEHKGLPLRHGTARHSTGGSYPWFSLCWLHSLTGQRLLTQGLVPLAASSQTACQQPQLIFHPSHRCSQAQVTPTLIYSH